jgi:hypothetical protein
MKRCPSCGTTYTDASLRYCLSDGASLTDLSTAEEATVVRSGGDAMRVDIPQTQPIIAPPTAQHTQSGGSSTVLKVVIGLLVLALLAVAGLGLAGLIYYKSSGGDGVVANVNSNRPGVSPSPIPSLDGTDELRKQIADLEKKLNEQKASNRPADIPLTLPNQTSTRSARVTSPGDGFLALRTYPSAQMGERILKIPHGASVTVGGCLAPSGGGRWCRASYNGYSGWVFDKYLIY